MRHALLVALLAFTGSFVAQTSSQAPAAADGIFRIHPLRPVEDLRKEALAAQPPKEAGKFRTPELVELVKLDPTIKLDIRYATDRNFLSTRMYSQARAFLQRPAAEALVRTNQSLKAKGYGLLIHDAYRPWYVTKMFWEATPRDKKIFVADPKDGSRHNRGCAVDLTLYDLRTGKAVAMPSLYDEMSRRAYADYPGGTEEERRHRALLRAAMEAQGFTVYPQEWWHFDYKDWRQYPIMNVRFEDIPAAEPKASSLVPEPSGAVATQFRQAALLGPGYDPSIPREPLRKQSASAASSEKIRILRRKSMRYSGSGLHSVSLREIF